MKKFFWMLLILFICGMVSADFSIIALQDKTVLLSKEQFTTYAYQKTFFQNAFWGILYERGKLFVLLFLVMFTPFREKMPIIFTGIFSFIWGYFLMSAIMSLGMAGIVVGIASVLPHGIIYLFTFLMFFYQRQSSRYIQREQMVSRILRYVLMMLLFITGCVLETVMGVQFVPWVIRLSLI